jgi:hypothetical protein
VEALERINGHGLHDLELMLGANSFDNDLAIATLDQEDDRLEERSVGGVVEEPLHKGSIDLKGVDWEILQIRE